MEPTGTLPPTEALRHVLILIRAAQEAPDEDIIHRLLREMEAVAKKGLAPPPTKP